MGATSVSESRRQRKRDLVYIHGEKCAICGYDKCIWGLCFHHIDSSTKLFGIANSNCRSIEKDIEESKKCILICQNCHSEIHAGLIDIKLKSSFNNNRAEKILDKRRLEKIHCKLCGKNITHKASYCSSCWKIVNRKVERPSRNEIKKMIRTMPFTTIGKKYGVNDNTIRKWCIAYKLPKRKKDIENYTDREWELI